MPYIFLALGLLIGLYALFRFFLNANIKQIKALFLTSAFIVICLALFFMAITGRLAGALALVVALAPIIHLMIKEWREKPTADNHAQANEISTKEEALNVLGLKDGAGEDDIQKAYKTLMQKVHPDKEGSEWLAAKLNQARDILLENERK